MEGKKPSFKGWFLAKISDRSSQLNQEAHSKLSRATLAANARSRKTEMGIHTCPELLIFPQIIRFAAISRSPQVAGSTITGLLPPSSSVNGVRCFAAAAEIIRATRPFPVYMMWSPKRIKHGQQPKWPTGEESLHFSSRSFVISGTAPVMTRYDAGSRYFATS
jgi:hypothetical protein